MDVFVLAYLEFVCYRNIHVMLGQVVTHTNSRYVRTLSFGLSMTSVLKLRLPLLNSQCVAHSEKIQCWGDTVIRKDHPS